MSFCIDLEKCLLKYIYTARLKSIPFVSLDEKGVLFRSLINTFFFFFKKLDILIQHPL